MIELIPKQNYLFTNRTLEELNTLREDADSFHNCRIIPEQPIKLEIQNVKMNTINNFLDPISLSFHNSISSGYSTLTYEVENTVAWGFERYGIFIEYSNDHVKSIWICNSAKFVKNNQPYSFFEAISLIARELDLILVDWHRNIVVDITNRKKLKDYLIKILAFNFLCKV
jgi:hypothetical protein